MYCQQESMSHLGWKVVAEDEMKRLVDSRMEASVNPIFFFCLSLTTSYSFWAVMKNHWQTGSLFACKFAYS